MGTWLAPNAIRCSHGLREPKYHSSSCLLSFNKRNTCHLKIQTQWNIQICHLQWDLSHRVKSCLCQASGKQTFSDDSCDSELDHEQLEEDSVDCDPTFEASCSSSQLNLLWKGDFNDLVRDLNFSKERSCTLRFQIKWVESSPPRYWNIFLSQSPKWIQRIILSRERYVIL